MDVHPLGIPRTRHLIPRSKRDRRLSGINNTGLTSGQYSNYGFTTTPENFISGITESSDIATVYPAAGAQTATYNNLNQLTNLSGQALTFDAVGNVTSDGARNYTWDAENRLVGITYPGVSGKATAFTYDGLGRRVTISSTPAGGGSATVTSYLWCGDSICQARNAANTPIKGYYDEGEYVPGTPGQPYYYGIDQIGSVRRAFVSSSSAPAYSFDPYGVPLQTTAPVTDFVYAGMFYSADSALYLAQYRAFDPASGRWLSRDPLGEISDPGYGNLYTYSGSSPISFSDYTGLDLVPNVPSANSNAPPAQGSVNPQRQAGCESTTGGNPPSTPTISFGPPSPAPEPPTVMAQQTCQQFIAANCKGSVLRVFPGQYLGVSVQQMLEDAKNGISDAQTAKKLMFDNRFRK